MKRPPAVLAALVLVSAAPAFAAPAAKPRPNTVTVYHWWSTPYEVAAIEALIDVFEKKYPDVPVTTAAHPSGGAAQGMFPVLRALVRAGNGPDAVQAHPGYEAQPLFDGQLLSPIDDLWAAQGLDKVVPSVVREMNKFEGRYYAVPIGVHRTNVLWYNKTLLDKHGINPATLATWDGFFKAVEDLRAKGMEFPIAVGMDWTVGHVFECITASQGIEVYEDWINGRINEASNRHLVGALNILKRYLTYTNREDYSLAYDGAMKRLVAGDAAFCIMGDWAVGEFRNAGLKYGKDFGSLPVPGTKGLYGLAIDIFLHPASIARPENSERWMKVVVSPEGQNAFNAKKGSIPARSDVDTADYDAYQKSAIADFKSAKAMYPSVGSGTPEAFKLRAIQIMGTFAADRDVDKAAAALAKLTAGLQKAYTRTWTLR
jgi:glucose/mannose transport system substrate-binding protein